MIEYLPAAALDEVILRARVYPRMDQTLYWSDVWDPAFYVAVARAGFICICVNHPAQGPILIPELQERYALLDWPNLRVSRNLRRIIRSGRLEEDELELRAANPCDHVLDRLTDYHGKRSWLRPPYLALMRALSNQPASGFSLHGVELWSRRTGELIAGELGYSIGGTYTSLSGFCTPDEPNWRNFGTLQQVLLAEALEESGYCFWNMGHVDMPYKNELGAIDTPRGSFLERWLEARDQTPPEPLANGDVLRRFSAA